jgi:predicted PurR-regulated permease PerM
MAAREVETGVSPPVNETPPRKRLSGFDSLPKTLAGIRDFSAAKGILLLLVGGLLYVGHAAFIPIALALLMALILSGPVEALHRLGMQRGLSAALILVLTLGALIGMASVLWTPLQNGYDNAPKTLAIVQAKVRPVAKLVQHLEELTSRATATNAQRPGPVTVPAAAAPFDATALPGLMLGVVRNAVIGFVTFLMVTLFLLAGGPPMVARMTAAFFDHLKANHVLNDIERVRHEVGHYYVVTSIINVGMGLATTAVTAAWGMPTPYLWGILAAALNYIPYVGSAATLLVVSVVALVSFDGVGHAVGVAASYVALAAIEGQLVQPWLIGRRMEVNPLLIFLGLWLGGFFWGVAGIVLATPMLVAMKVIAKHSLHGEAMMQFLSPSRDAPTLAAKRTAVPAKA